MKSKILESNIESENYLVDFSEVSDSLILIFSKSYINPISQIDEISNKVRLISCRNCKVLFDLLQTNGDSFNRFVSGEFKNGEIDYFTLHVDQDINKEVIDKCNLYYFSNRKKMNNGILPLKIQYRST